MDGNFQAEHMRMRNPENDVQLSDGAGFMVSKTPYELHLKSAVERQQVGAISRISAGICSHSESLTEINVPRPPCSEQHKQT